MVTIWSVFECLNCVINLVVNLLLISSNPVCRNASEWKISHQFTKKNNKLCVKNYSPVRLPPICSKALERTICNTIFAYFTKNNLIFENQSGFKSCDFCVNQFLAITDKLFFGFDDSYAVRGVFLDISEAFDVECDIRELFINLNAKGSQKID